MLRLSMDFHPDFCDLYNRLNTKENCEYLKLSGISRDKLDLATMSKDYFNDYMSDMSVDPNANAGQRKCLNTFTSEVTKGLLRLDGYYLLWKYIYKLYDIETANELISLSIKGQYYPHDLAKVSVPYCVAVSTSHIMTMGRPYGNLKSTPPKRASSFIAQSIEHLMTLSQEFAGAIAFGDLLVNYAWYISKEYSEDDLQSEKLEKKIENDLQSFVHVANNNFRIGGDSPFSNISLYCTVTLKSMFEHYYYPDGSHPNDIIDFIMRIQEIFMKFISKKDPIGGIPYRFPVTTINLFVDREDKRVLDLKFLDLVSEYNKEGCFNIFITSDKARIASCCRMINNKTDLMGYKGIDSFGNGGLNIGSHRVVTINMVRVARLSKSIEDFKCKFYEAMEDTVKILMAHRSLIKDRIDQGFLQFFKPYNWLNFDTMFFSTIGINGIYEACQCLGFDILEDQTQIIDILNFINSEKDRLAEKYQIPINLEQIPGESAAITFAKKDAVFFEDQPHKLYANQFIPLWATDINIVDRAIIDGKLSRYFGGGVISHLNIAAAATKDQMRDLIRFASFTGLDHFALNPCFSVCKNEHTTITKSDVCPICGEDIDTRYTRIVGYFTPVNDWVKERREFEFPRRRFNFLGHDGDNIQATICKFI